MAQALVRKACPFWLTEARRHVSGIWRQRFADFLLFGVTSAELALLFVLTPTFTITDWIYVLQNLLVLGIALTRRPPELQDHSLASSAAVIAAYGYTYAQVAYLRWVPGEAAWPAGGLVLVTLAACLSLASLLTLGRRFGVRPALRGLATKGPYRVVRHPIYLAYVVADIGYNLQEWNLRHRAAGTGGMGLSALPHPGRRTDAVSGCRLAGLWRPRALPPAPRPLVGARAQKTPPASPRHDDETILAHFNPVHFSLPAGQEAAASQIE